MQFLSIGVGGCKNSIAEKIKKELQHLKNKNIDCKVDEVTTDGCASIICSIEEDGTHSDKFFQSYKIMKALVSNVLGDYIIYQYEEKLIGRIINNNYCYFNSIERSEILKLALKIIRNEEKSFLNSLFRLRRRNIIVRKLIEYFECSDNLIIEGFVNFRLKEYIKDLEEIVDRAVDDFLMEREYKEFIRLLKYFVDIQVPKYDTNHVIADYDGKYALLDEKKNEITGECIHEFINEISDGEINYDDLLVSSLITFAPKKIVIHCKGQLKNKELLETIKSVFSGKVVLCSGCEMCILNMARNENK
jgi:putative sporulation protein YtxC